MEALWVLFLIFKMWNNYTVLGVFLQHLLIYGEDLPFMEFDKSSEISPGNHANDRFT